VPTRRPAAASLRAVTRLAIAALVATPLACASGAADTGSARPHVTPAAASAAAASAAPVRAPVVSHSPAAPACHPEPLQRLAAATLIVGLPDTQNPNDPLAISAPALGVGGILLESANVQSAEQVRTLVAAIRARRGGPLLVTTDEEGGRVTSFSSAIGWEPSARATSPLGPAELQQRAKLLGQQLHSLGVTVDFAPDLDVTGGPDDAPIGDRSYSDDPATA
jgi:beta-N-acetylhexosaminidase